MAVGAVLRRHRNPAADVLVRLAEDHAVGGGWGRNVSARAAHASLPLDFRCLQVPQVRGALSPLTWVFPQRTQRPTSSALGLASARACAAPAAAMSQLL